MPLVSICATKISEMLQLALILLILGALALAASSVSGFERDLDRIPLLQKCCPDLEMVEISESGCAYCKKSDTSKKSKNETKLAGNFPKFRLNEILLPSTLSAAAEDSCQTQKMKRVTLSPREFQSNLTSTSFLRLGRVAYDAKQFCVARIGANPPEIEVFVPQNVVNLHKCCGLEQVFNLERNRCEWVRETRVRGHKRRFLPSESGRWVQKRGQGAHGTVDPLRQFVGTNLSYGVVENWLDSAIREGKSTKVKNFTNRVCWGQQATRFRISGASHASEPSLLLQYESHKGVFLRGAWKTVQGPDFCVDQVRNGHANCDGSEFEGQNHQIFAGLPEDEGTGEIAIVFYIADEEEDPVSYALLMGLSWWVISGFLAVAAVVNVTIIQKNIHGWVFFSYLITSALLNVVAGVFIILADAETFPDINTRKTGCNFFDFVQKFLYLSTLCWMTAINFDLWYAFRLIHRKLEPNLHSSARRFPFYVLFSWLLPITVISCGWFLGNLHAPPAPLPHCIIYDRSTIVYMSGPVVLLIALNLVLFTRTVVTIRSLRNASMRVLRQSHCERESFKLFTKLFLMTGPIWILRIVLLVLQINGSYLTWYGTLIEFLFMVPDLAFFCMVILHRKVIERLRTRFPCLRGILCCAPSATLTSSPATKTTGLRIHYGNSRTSLSTNRRKSSGGSSGSMRMVTFEGGGSKLAAATNGRSHNRASVSGSVYI